MSNQSPAAAMARFVGKRSDGTIIVSVGDPWNPPHWQGDWPLSMEEAVLWHAAPDLLAALRRARQFIDITKKGYEEVEIDGEMVDPYEFVEEIDAALALALARASAGGAG